MVPQDKDLILKEKVKLYNNIGKINDCEGRLLAELEIYPTPRINWDFEIIGNVECNVPHSAAFQLNPLNPLKGYSFFIDEPFCSGDYFTVIGPVRAMRGSTAQAFYGDIDKTANIFTFYLPNTRFQRMSNGQNVLTTQTTETATGKQVELKTGGKCIDLPIDDTWNISLEIRNEALEWLKPENRNIGTRITTVGQLYQPKYKATEPETFSELQTITLKDTLDRLKNLNWVLSYANGGYLGSLYVQGEQYTQDIFHHVITSCAVAQASQTTPLEQLGYSWITSNSDLTGYLKCFSTFERMIQNTFWNDTFDFVLNQYFQATRPMTWEIRASAAGAALERLSYTILVEEETDATKQAKCKLLFAIRKNKEVETEYKEYCKSSKYQKEDEKYLSMTGIRLSLLLERIGLINDINPDKIQSFLDVRNDAVHPRVGTMTDEQRWPLIKQAIQWIDEVLLWRLGYSGEYLDRTQGISINSRYDLSLRDPNW
ncbi:MULTISPECIES: hypothetical protein [unclassified Dolichospermum]|jgi:hypothetical protein|uniref:hypothetical protein n=1 Tax=unclassified Dolichospermum TaxID=2622029 RepID=UPI001446B225|nr:MULTISPECIES: hypothetical protein [unclassified Dolichospermum]MTJ18349.1 hypothetical protein [Dolichospermum sp. UHCC 0299]MTJ37446.1 hypothetical protein [Dolichospermum sp. UHCC 0406]